MGKTLDITAPDYWQEEGIKSGNSSTQHKTRSTIYSNKYITIQVREKNGLWELWANAHQVQPYQLQHQTQ